MELNDGESQGDAKKLTRQIMEEYASLLLSGHFKALTVPPYEEPE